MLRLSLAALLALIVMLPAGRVLGHGGAGAFVIVPADHVVPGESFDVVVADMGAGSEIVLTIEAPERSESLATVTAAPDGHFHGSVDLPANFPDGYAQLIVSGSDGSVASTWVLVSPRRAGAPSSPDSGSWWTDPSVVLLGAFVIGALAVVGYLLLRPKPRAAVSVAAARRPISNKARRARRR